MKPVLYMYRSCSSCRNAERALDEAVVRFETREVFKQRLSRDELHSLLRHGGIAASERISSRAKAFRGRGLDQRTMRNDDT